MIYDAKQQQNSNFSAFQFAIRNVDELSSWNASSQQVQQETETAAAEEEQLAASTSLVFDRYLSGQLANVVKASVWWATFGVMVEALTRSRFSVGPARLLFNSALVFSSPVAGSVVEVRDYGGC